MHADATRCNLSRMRNLHNAESHRAPSSDGNFGFTRLWIKVTVCACFLTPTVFSKVRKVSMHCILRLQSEVAETFFLLSHYQYICEDHWDTSANSIPYCRASALRPDFTVNLSLRWHCGSLAERSAVNDIALHLVLTMAVCVCERERERRVGAPRLVCDTRRDGARLDCCRFSTHHAPRGQLITEADGLMVKQEHSFDRALVRWPSR